MQVKKAKKHRKFFIVEDGDVCVVNTNYFQSLSMTDIVNVGVSIYVTLLQQLTKDALLNRPERIGSITIADGLQRSLMFLEKRNPYLMKEIHSVKRRNAGQRIYES